MLFRHHDSGNTCPQALEDSKANAIKSCKEKYSVHSCNILDIDSNTHDYGDACAAVSYASPDLSTQSKIQSPRSTGIVTFVGEGSADCDDCSMGNHVLTLCLTSLPARISATGISEWEATNISEGLCAEDIFDGKVIETTVTTESKTYQQGLYVLYKSESIVSWATQALMLGCYVTPSDGSYINTSGVLTETYSSCPCLEIIKEEEKLISKYSKSSNQEITIKFIEKIRRFNKSRGILENL